MHVRVVRYPIMSLKTPFALWSSGSMAVLPAHTQIVLALQCIDVFAVLRDPTAIEAAETQGQLNDKSTSGAQALLHDTNPHCPRLPARACCKCKSSSVS